MDSVKPQLSAEELRQQAILLQEQAKKMEQEAREKVYEEERARRIKREEDDLIAELKKNGPQVREVVKNVENVLGITMKGDLHGGAAIKEAVAEHGSLYYTGRYGSTSITIEVNPIVHRKNGLRYGYDKVQVGVLGMRAEWYNDRRSFNKLYKVTSWDKAIDHFVQKATEIKVREDAIIAKKKTEETKKQTIEEAIKACFKGVPFDIRIEQNYYNRSVSPTRSSYEPSGTYNVTLYKPDTHDRVTGYSSVYVTQDGVVKGTFSEQVNIKDHYHATH